MEHENKPRNYIHIRNFNPIFDHYMYADVPDYYADDVFVKDKVFVIFGQEAEHPDYKYRLVFAKCLRWQKRRFLKALAELHYVININGHSDYDDYCEKFIERFWMKHKHDR